MVPITILTKQDWLKHKWKLVPLPQQFIQAREKQCKFYHSNNQLVKFLKDYPPQFGGDFIMCATFLEKNNEQDFHFFDFIANVKSLILFRSSGHVEYGNNLEQVEFKRREFYKETNVIDFSSGRQTSSSELKDLDDPQLVVYYDLERFTTPVKVFWNMSNIGWMTEKWKWLYRWEWKKELKKRWKHELPYVAKNGEEISFRDIIGNISINMPPHFTWEDVKEIEQNMLYTLMYYKPHDEEEQAIWLWKKLYELASSYMKHLCALLYESEGTFGDLVIPKGSLKTTSIYVHQYDGNYQIFFLETDAGYYCFDFFTS